MTVGSEAKLTVETLGAFIDDRYAAWARQQVGDDTVSVLKTGFADWLSEPLTTLSAWRIESWRRDQLDLLVQPLMISRQLQALDGCLKKAVEWLIIESNPLHDVGLEATDHFIELFSGGMGHGYLRAGWAPVASIGHGRWATVRSWNCRPSAATRTMCSRCTPWEPTRALRNACSST